MHLLFHWGSSLSLIAFIHHNLFSGVAASSAYVALHRSVRSGTVPHPCEQRERRFGSQMATGWSHIFLHFTSF
jgi:hypothetical protein